MAKQTNPIPQPARPMSSRIFQSSHEPWNAFKCKNASPNGLCLKQMQASPHLAALCTTPELFPGRSRSATPDAPAYSSGNLPGSLLAASPVSEPDTGDSLHRILSGMMLTVRFWKRVGSSEPRWSNRTASDVARLTKSVKRSACAAAEQCPAFSPGCSSSSPPHRVLPHTAQPHHNSSPTTSFLACC